MSADDRYSYTFNIVLTVVGPDADWREVEGTVRERIEGLRIRGGFRVVSANLDTAGEPEA